MKTISIRLSDDDYKALDAMLREMGQTRQSFYETYTKTALRERRIPFIIKASPLDTRRQLDRSEAFLQLEKLRQEAARLESEYQQHQEIEEAYHEKYGYTD